MIRQVFFVVLVSVASGSLANAERSLEQRLFSCLDANIHPDRLRCYDTVVSDLAKEKEDTQSSLSISENLALSPAEIQQFIEADHTRSDRITESERFGRLTANQPGYFSAVAPVDDELNDELHGEFYLSIKYPLIENQFTEWREGSSGAGSALGRQGDWLIPNRLFLIYNGLYDFYALGSDRYASSPIVSRRQNPGFSFEWDIGDGRRKFRLGWLHESNGQELDPGENGEGELIFNRLEENFGADFALARVSRGWDYAQFRYESSRYSELDDRAADWYRWQVEFRAYCDCQGFGADSGREDDIWWDESDDSKIGDYDGLRFLGETVASNRYFDTLFRLELKTGVRDIDAVQNLGFKIAAVWDFENSWFNNTRWNLFYFNGYGREPSTYHLRTEYAGFGVELR